MTSKHWHALSSDQVARQLDVDPACGLSSEEASHRLESTGPNALERHQPRSAWFILLEQFKSIVILLLVGALVLALSLREWPEAVALVIVIGVNTLIGFVSEWKAARSIEALRSLTQREARVRRDGTTMEVSTESLVPGDVVLLSTGDLIPADLRLLSDHSPRVNEAALTGESMPIVKRDDALDSEIDLADRTCMLYMGTSIDEGDAIGVVVATGMDTELGRISELASEAESTTTPLQQRLDSLGRSMAILVIIIAVAVAAVGYFVGGKELRTIVETSVALGVAAIPEGLPIVATIALARGMWRMVRRHALVNRLTAVETLGATRIICTDKTGTLTENQMTLVRVATPAQVHEIGDDAGKDLVDDDPLLARVLLIGVLCNNASLRQRDDSTGEAVNRGDPTEIALLEAGERVGLDRTALLESKYPELRESPFDPDRMMMATFHQEDRGVLVAAKGAPSAVLEQCATIANADGETSSLDAATRSQWENCAEALAREGLRVLAIAEQHADNAEVEPYEALRFLGLVGMIDPPRADVRDAIAECRHAGIRVIMVTGDQPATGTAVARQVGIVDEDDTGVRAVRGRELESLDTMSIDERTKLLDAAVFARVSPEQKLRLVGALQDQNETVAMTGDGVNDAPALKKADIGVAMGQRGTDAARQVADMILEDDRFSTIVAAVHQGRIIFENIRKSVIFMLCTNGAEILAVTIASLIPGWPLPLTALQILFLNMLTDVFPALALGAGPGHPDVMERPPRPKGEDILTGRHWCRIAVYGTIIALSVLGSLVIGWFVFEVDATSATTMSFLTLAFAKLWFVLNLRAGHSRMLDNEIVRNPWIWGSLALCIGLLLAATYTPVLHQVLSLSAPDVRSWGVILGMSTLPVVVGQIWIALRPGTR